MSVYQLPGPHDLFQSFFNDKWDKLDAAPVPPFEPGHGDDLQLNHLYYVNWPDAWTWPNPYLDPSPIESEAINYADALTEEHDHAIQDWGDPGKNHMTLLKYDD